MEQEKLSGLSLPTSKGTVVTNKKFVIALDSIMDVPNVFIDGKDVSSIDGDDLGLHDVIVQWSADTSLEGDKMLFIKNFVKVSDNGGVIEQTTKETNMEEYL